MAPRPPGRKKQRHRLSTLYMRSHLLKEKCCDSIMRFLRVSANAFPWHISWFATVWSSSIYGKAEKKKSYNNGDSEKRRLCVKLVPCLCVKRDTTKNYHSTRSRRRLYASNVPIVHYLSSYRQPTADPLQDILRQVHYVINVLWEASYFHMCQLKLNISKVAPPMHFRHGK